MNIYLKADRFFAWVLFLGMLLYFISGYGMTKGIIDAEKASDLHLDILTYIILIAFTIHTSFAIHLALKRWRIWGWPTKTILILFFTIFFLSFIYVDRYYEPRVEAPAKSNSSANAETHLEQTQSNASKQTDTTKENSEKIFTLSELSKYDGKNGNPAYTAVDGNVYDMTAVFPDGKHYSHFAGKELTNAFYSRHAKSALSKYPIVGKLVD